MPGGCRIERASNFAGEWPRQRPNRHPAYEVRVAIIGLDFTHSHHAPVQYRLAHIPFSFPIQHDSPHRYLSLKV